MRKVDDYQTTRVWVSTHKRLRLIAPLPNESMVQVLDQLSKQELARLQATQEKKEK